MRTWSLRIASLVLLITTSFACRDSGEPKPEVVVENEKQPEDVKQDPVQAIRARYIKQSPDALKIVEPITLVKAYYFKDGGTKGILLKDANGVEHHFCLTDSSIWDEPRVKDKDSSKNPKNPSKGAYYHGLYVGAVHPTDKNAKSVEWHGPEESALYGVMLRWVSKHPQRQALYDEKIDLNGAEHGNLWAVRAFFLRLDQRFVGR